ncbi:MAG TPA: hypothetical protein VFV38_46880 [Ktedonobacteraceae bacterium]|nr:hypothetical protein [Ktedonobacteraceae bacterium]
MKRANERLVKRLMQRCRGNGKLCLLNTAAGLRASRSAFVRESCAD